MPRGSRCAPEVCDDGLVCDVFDVDASYMPLPEAQVCHLRCDYGITQCSNGEACLPCANGANVAQQNAQGAVPCDPGRGDADCDTSTGFHCGTFQQRSLCTKPLSACGQSIAPFDFRATPPPSSYCNLGASRYFGTTFVTADRFCRTYPELANPPEAECQYLLDDAPLGVGVCVAVCHRPALGTRAAVTHDCPSGMQCVYATSPTSVIVNGSIGQPIACASSSDCTGIPDGYCQQVASGARYCAQRTGICLPP